MDRSALIFRAKKVKKSEYRSLVRRPWGFRLGILLVTSNLSVDGNALWTDRVLPCVQMVASL